MKIPKRDPLVVPLILRKLQEGAHITGELLGVFLADYQESYRKARQLAYGRGPSEPSGKDWGEAYIEFQRFYNVLSYLQRQGLVGKDKQRGERQARWHITAAGKKKLQERIARERARYRAERDNTLRVIIFDVPEEERAQRDWLREAIRALGFTLLQESVWIGARKIPDRFLFELKERNLLPCVHIFSVYKEGSIPLVDKGLYSK